MAAIRAKEIFYLYRAAHGDVPALRGLSLQVADGEVVSVLGPSGAGKTTLLGLCEGSLRPSSGDLSVLGDPGHASLGRLGRVRRNSIGIVRQHYNRALPRDLTSEEIVALPLRLLGERRKTAAQRARTLLGEAGLGHRLSAKPGDLSGGEQQRVAICAALAKRPRLLLADEPTGELDPKTSAEVVELLLGLARESNAAALIVTHDPEVALRTDRTIHIRDGRLAAEGTTRPVLIVDQQGWLRLPERLREQAGVRERVRAAAGWGRIELVAEDVERSEAPTPRREEVLRGPKRSGVEVAVQRVSKAYGPQHVLRGLSQWLAAEQLHVVAGPSGSGKTTFLNLLAALERPDEGCVWVGGARVDSLGGDEAADWRRHTIGYVSQHSTLVDFLSARENVELAVALRAVPEDEARERAEEWLEWVGLAKIADRRADRLSGGEQRRVALARALAPQPRLLLADEPTAHLDRVSGRSVIRLLQRAIEDGTTVVAASHDPDLISAAETCVALGLDAPRSNCHAERR